MKDRKLNLGNDYDIGDKVFLMFEGKIRQGVISAIKIKASTELLPSDVTINIDANYDNGDGKVLLVSHLDEYEFTIELYYTVALVQTNGYGGSSLTYARYKYDNELFKTKAELIEYLSVY